MLAPPLLHDYENLTKNAGFVDVSARSKIEMRGVDRAAFLHNFCTNDIKRLQPGDSCEAFVCNVKGHALGHINIFCGSESLWIDTVPDQATKLLAHWDRYLIREKVELFDRTDEFGAILLAGPRTLEKLTTIRTQLMGTLQRLPHWPQQAHLLTFPLDAKPTNLQALEAAEIHSGSSEAWEIVRVEAGLPQYGSDISVDNLPQEVDRNAAAISFTKGCYLGQETVARIDALGHVNHLLRGLALDASILPPPGTELHAEGKPVARLTSVVWSPTLQCPLALAYLRRGFDKIGTTIENGRVIPWPLGNLPA